MQMIRQMNLFFQQLSEENGAPVATIKDNDSVSSSSISVQTVQERSQEHSVQIEFDGFDRAKRLALTYVCFTEYDVTIPNKEIAFKKVELKNTFGEFLAEQWQDTGKDLLRQRNMHMLPSSLTVVWKNRIRGRRPYPCKITKGSYL